MESLDPPPDPLLPFLVLPAAAANPSISTPPPPLPQHQSPDPPPPSPDLQSDGPQSVPHSSSTGTEANNTKHQSPARSAPISQGTSEASKQPLAPLLQATAQDSSQLPASPTEIDPDLQAQAWALLPDLAMDLNRLQDQQSGSVVVEGRYAINPQLESAHKISADEGNQAKVMELQESTEIEGTLLRSRIPASQKGKAVQGAADIHGGQSTTNYAQATSSELKKMASHSGASACKSMRLEASASKSTCLETSAPRGTHQEPSNLNIVISEEGWEPAKPYRRKRQDTENRTIQTSNQQSNKPTGSVFFRSKMEGRCYNCFSPNHLARSCHRPTRCWKCYHSGHQAIDCTANSRPTQHKSPKPAPFTTIEPVQNHNTQPDPPKTDHCSYAEVVRGHSAMAARYPGDPRARPARGFCAVTATGSIRRRRDELVGRAAVCWLNGNSHNTEMYHLDDALRSQLNLHIDDFQVVKHFPEQYLVIFSDPAVMERVVDLGVFSDRGRDFHFAAWTERRYANITTWDYRVKVRIEGIPVHCWAAEVAAKALGKSCAIHYVEETTRRQERTRSFDLWAWCCDPCDIPTEVWLTVTEPDRVLPLTNIPPHFDDPVCLKRGHEYVLRNHLEVVEDLSFLQGRGRVGGPPNRKPRREFIWSYGVSDTEGERLHGQRGNNRGCDIRRQPRRDNDDYNRHNNGNRRHRSLSVWARSSRCRAAEEDCISSNRWRGRGVPPPHRSRPAAHVQAPTQVWRVKEHMEKKHKKVSFADPIATELKATKITIPDDSILLIMETQVTKELEGERLSNTLINTPSMLIKPREQNSENPLPVIHADAVMIDTAPDWITAGAEIFEVQHGLQHVESAGNTSHMSNSTDPLSESANADSNAQPNLQGTDTMLTSVPIPTEMDAGNDGEGMDVVQHVSITSQQLGLMLSSPSPVPVVNEVVNDQQGSFNSHSSIADEENLGASQTSQVITETVTVSLQTAGEIPEHHELLDDQSVPNLSEAQQLITIDNFIDSISKPIPEPLLVQCAMTPRIHTTRNPNTSLQASQPPSSSKRHSSRLAQKAANNSGKDAIQIAQDLLVKKLGELSGEEIEQDPADFDFYAQHFDRPIDMVKTEAIKVLVEQGAKNQKSNIQKGVATAQSLVA